uniref:Uncharacterized protein n=1 Tax=Manihot esculenta TaxID=3983 RepID=A0A2C9VH08_MANES
MVSTVLWFPVLYLLSPSTSFPKSFHSCLLEVSLSPQVSFFLLSSNGIILMREEILHMQRRKDEWHHGRDQIK